MLYTSVLCYCRPHNSHYHSHPPFFHHLATTHSPLTTPILPPLTPHLSPLTMLRPSVVGEVWPAVQLGRRNLLERRVKRWDSNSLICDKKFKHFLHQLVRRQRVDIVNGQHVLAHFTNGKGTTTKHVLQVRKLLGASLVHVWSQSSSLYLGHLQAHTAGSTVS